jgi:UDP-glucose 4-epimerase
VNRMILIVGGAGYIGSMVNQLLHQRGYQTVVLDNLSTGHPGTVSSGELVIGDLGDRSLVRKLLRSYQIDGVIHFAASISVGESVVAPAKYYENNVCKTVALLDELIAHEIKRVVFSSSAAVYGIPTTVQVAEEAPKNPINPYGRTKWMVEQVLQDYALPYQLRSCSLRYFNAAGGDPDGKIRDERKVVQNLIPIALRSLLTGNPLPIFGTDYETPDGTAIRDYIHIYDLAEAHLLALESLFAGGVAASAYNLGVGRGYSVREVVAAIEEVTGRRLNLVERERRPGDPPALIADPSKAERELHWRAARSDIQTIVLDAWRATQPVAAR